MEIIMPHGYNSSTIQRINLKLIFNLIRKQQAHTRVELAKKTGLSAATVSNIVNSLIHIGLLYEYPMATNGVGRRSIGLKINYDRFHIIHLRITVSSIFLGRYNLQEVQQKYKVISYTDSTSRHDLLRELKDAVGQELSSRLEPPILGIGISLPEPYDKGSSFDLIGELVNWEGIDICHEIQTEFHIPVYAENDANIGALYEWWKDSSITDKDTLVYITTAEGTGAGIVSAGMLLRGRQGVAGEIGHMSVDFNGPLCKCGNRGCLELYTSTLVMTKKAREEAAKGADTCLSPDCSKKEFFRAVLDGDPLARSIFDSAMQYMGTGIINIIYLYNPSIIVFGDEMVSYGVGDLLLTLVRRFVAERVTPQISEKVTMRLSTVNHDPAFLGAGVLVLNNISDILFDQNLFL